MSRPFRGHAPARSFSGGCRCWRCVARRLPTALADALFTARLLPRLWRDLDRR